MMRMGLIVVGLSILTVMELRTASPTKKSVPDSFEQLTVDVSVSSDTLETADRLEIHRAVCAGFKGQHRCPID
jgi:hypothetical protein